MHIAAASGKPSDVSYQCDARSDIGCVGMSDYANRVLPQSSAQSHSSPPRRPRLPTSRPAGVLWLVFSRTPSSRPTRRNVGRLGGGGSALVRCAFVAHDTHL